MSEVSLLLPSVKGAFLWTGVWILSVSFSNTIGLGSIIITVAVLFLGGLFTLRNNMKTFWKELAEERGAQVSELEKDLHEQKELVLELRAAVSVADAAVEAERAKRDLTPIVQRLDSLDHMLQLRWEAFEAFRQTQMSQEHPAAPSD